MLFPASPRTSALLSARIALALGLSLTGLSAPAQGPAEWSTSSVDPARDAWQQGPSHINRDTAAHLQVLWKVKLENQTMGMQSFREPLIIPGVTSGGASHTVAYLAGASNDLFALDADTGAFLWKKKLKWASTKPQEPGEGRGFICTNAQSATPVVTPLGAPGPRLLYVLTSDGYLHTVDLSTGDEPAATIQVLPLPYGKPYGLNLVNNVLYTVTGQGCGGVPNALYAVDLATRKVIVSSPPQAGLWGVAGPAIGADGTIYFESGDGPYDASSGKLATSMQAYTFANGTLALKDYYTPTNYEWLTRRDLDMNSSPVVFPWKGRDLVVGSGKEGRFFVTDSRDMGGANHMTPLFRSPLISNANVNFQTEGTWGSMASWLGPDGTRWLLAPTGGKSAVPFPVSDGPTPNGGIIAMKLIDRAGLPELAPAWISHDMLTAEPPVILNGVVLALAGGEYTVQADDTRGGLFSAEDRVRLSKPAKLYALDALTGKQIFASGPEITSFLHQAGLAVAGDRIIFGTFDGTVYCFGLK